MGTGFSDSLIDADAKVESGSEEAPDNAEVTTEVDAVVSSILAVDVILVDIIFNNLFEFYIFAEYKIQNPQYTKLRQSKIRNKMLDEAGTPKC